MPRKKAFRIPGVSFSMNRALGISRVKRSISRATGIPTTRSGRQRKIGQAVTGGCLLQVLAVIGAIVALVMTIATLI